MPNVTFSWLYENVQGLKGNHDRKVCQLLLSIFQSYINGLIMFDVFSDKRVEKWFMMQSYVPTLALTVLYLFSVWAGMKIMRHRAAYQLKTTLLIYNTLMVALNFHIFYEVSSYKDF